MVERKSPPSDASLLDAERALDAAALKAFAHPLRTRMYSLLGNHGPATATQLARQLGESTGQTSYHLRQLERHGLVEEDVERGTARERWWRAASFSLQGRAMRGSPDTAPAATMLLAAMVRERAALLQAWVEDTATPEPWVAASLEQSTGAVLSREELLALNREVQQVIARHLAVAEGRERLAGEPAPDGGDYRRVRIYYDAFPVPALASGSGSSESR